MMLFDRNRLRPRRFVYYPRYYDPSRERDRRERMDFGRLRSKRDKLPGGRSPAWFFLLIIVVLAIVWKLGTLGGDLSQRIEVELDTSDVPTAIVTVTQKHDATVGEGESARSDSLQRDGPSGVNEEAEE